MMESMQKWKFLVIMKMARQTTVLQITNTILSITYINLTKEKPLFNNSFTPKKATLYLEWLFYLAEKFCVKKLFFPISFYPAVFLLANWLFANGDKYL